MAASSTTDTAIKYVNSDSTTATNLATGGSTGTNTSITSPYDVAVDTAAGLYFVIDPQFTGGGSASGQIHVGHLAAAVAVRAELALDVVLLVVANRPWQKVGEREVTDAADLKPWFAARVDPTAVRCGLRSDPLAAARPAALELYDAGVVPSVWSRRGPTTRREMLTWLRTSTSPWIPA